MTEPTREARPARRFHPASLVVLTGVWVLLWDQISLFIVLTGLLLALLVGLVFPPVSYTHLTLPTTPYV